jgi:thiamine transport system permease protein
MGDLGVIALVFRAGAGDAADGDVPADGLLPHGGCEGAAVLLMLLALGLFWLFDRGGRVDARA